MAIQDVFYEFVRRIGAGAPNLSFIVGGTVRSQLVGAVPDIEPLVVDDIADSLVILPTVHHKVHEGEMFTVSFIDLSVADNADIEILLRTGNKHSHFTFFTSCGGNAEIELVENPTVNDQGTALTEYNNKRFSANVNATNAFHTPNVTGGNVVLNAILAGGTGGNSAGGLLRADTEFVLQTSQDYVIRVTNMAGNAQPASIIANWYEH